MNGPVKHLTSASKSEFEAGKSVVFYPWTVIGTAASKTRMKVGYFSNKDSDAVPLFKPPNLSYPTNWQGQASASELPAHTREIQDAKNAWHKDLAATLSLVAAEPAYSGWQVWSATGSDAVEVLGMCRPQFVDETLEAYRVQSPMPMSDDDVDTSQDDEYDPVAIDEQKHGSHRRSSMSVQKGEPKRIDSGIVCEDDDDRESSIDENGNTSHDEGCEMDIGTDSDFEGWDNEDRRTKRRMSRLGMI